MSTITVLYFASFRETLKTDKESIELDDNVSKISDLKQHLANRQGEWKSIFAEDSSILISINQNMAKNHSDISDGDEIAFFPPVTGG